MIIAMLAEKPEISIPNKLSYAELQILANSIFQLRLRKIAARKLSESITVKPGEQVKIVFKMSGNYVVAEVVLDEDRKNR